MPSSKINEFDLDSSVFDGMVSNEDLEEIKSSLNTIDINVTSVKNDVATVKTNVGTVNTNIDSVKNSIEAIDEKIDDLNITINNSSGNGSLYDSIICAASANDNLLATVVSSEYSHTYNTTVYHKVYTNGIKGRLRVSLSTRTDANYYYIQISDSSGNRIGYIDSKANTSYQTQTIDITLNPNITDITISVHPSHTNNKVYCNLITISGTLTPINHRIFTV